MQNRVISSARELKNLRSLITCSLLIALYVALNSLSSVYITQELKLTFSYIALAMIGYRFGIITGFFGGALCDLLAYVIRPSGPLHLGFTLSTALTCVVFGIFLYKREFKWWTLLIRTALSRTIVNLFINIALNTFWLSNLYGKGYIVMLFQRVLKNILLLPIEVAILFFVLKAFERILKQLNQH